MRKETVEEVSINLTIAALCICLLWLLNGCATAHTRCFFEDGKLTYSTARSTVIGKGIVSSRTAACAELKFNAQDGGLNPEALEAIAKGAVKGLMPL